MVQLHEDKEKFEEKKIKVIAICPESEEKIKKFLNKQNLDLTFVADPSHSLAKSYNQQVSIFKLGRMPAQILLDKEGKRFFEHYSNSMMDIIKNEQILDLVK